jgi:hypothetical protein
VHLLHAEEPDSPGRVSPLSSCSTRLRYRVASYEGGIVVACANEDIYHLHPSIRVRLQVLPPCPPRSHRSVSRNINGSGHRTQRSPDDPSPSTSVRCLRLTHHRKNLRKAKTSCQENTVRNKWSRPPRANARYMIIDGRWVLPFYILWYSVFFFFLGGGGWYIGNVVFRGSKKSRNNPNLPLDVVLR